MASCGELDAFLEDEKKASVDYGKEAIREHDERFRMMWAEMSRDEAKHEGYIQQMRLGQGCPSSDGRRRYDGERPTRLKELTPIEQRYVRNYVTSICDYLSRGPPGEPPSVTERQRSECERVFYEDEEKLVEQALHWRAGLRKVLGPETI